MSARILRFDEAQWRDHCQRRGWTTHFSPPIAGEANAHDVAAADGPKRKPGRALHGGPEASAAVDVSERDILKACIRALALDSRVAWATRINSGAYAVDGRFVRFGFKGCADIIGQMSDGRFLAIEVKREGKKPTDDQVAFLGRVSRAGGVAFVAWSADDIGKGLA
jgi:hypothetical protein